GSAAETGGNRTSPKKSSATSPPLQNTAASVARGSGGSSISSISVSLFFPDAAPALNIFINSSRVAPRSLKISKGSRSNSSPIRQATAATDMHGFHQSGHEQSVSRSRSFPGKSESPTSLKTCSIS